MCEIFPPISCLPLHFLPARLKGYHSMCYPGTWWYRVSIGRYWFIFDGTVSVYGDTGWYLVVHGQYRAFMPVSIGKWRFGWVLPMCYSLTGRQTTKYSTTQLV